MRINDNSSFFLVPTILESRQRILLEGIRYSINMAFNAWDNLRYILKSISSTGEYGEGRYYAFMFAWSLIDSLDRLKSLFNRLGTTGFNDLYSSVENLRAMRNTYHHIYDRIESSLEVNFPLIGSLSWTYKSNESQKIIQLNNLISGAVVGTMKIPALNPAEFTPIEK
jgi:hypothetical protein